MTNAAGIAAQKLADLAMSDDKAGAAPSSISHERKPPHSARVLIAPDHGVVADIFAAAQP
jgi:hypothetical protein